MSARVLLVDDEAAVRRQLSVGLAERGFEVTEAGDGLSALQAIDRQVRAGKPFHAVVTDAGLPDFDGRKLLSVIKSRLPELRVLVLAAGDPGPEAALVKPVNPEALAGLLADLREAPGPAAAPPPETGAAAAAYVFVELKAGGHPWDALRGLAFGQNVLYCDPVRDDRWDLVLVLHGPTHEELERRVKEILGARSDVAAWELLKVEPPALGEDVRAFMEPYGREIADSPVYRRTPDRATAYLVIDAHPADRAGLYPRLYFLDEVVEIDAVAAGSRLVVLLQGADFAHIRRVINERIRLLDGVLRVHEMKVVPLEKA